MQLNCFLLHLVAIFAVPENLSGDYFSLIVELWVFNQYPLACETRMNLCNCQDLGHKATSIASLRSEESAT